MKYIVFFALVALCMPALTGAAPSSLAEVDALYSKRLEGGNAAKALEGYENAVKENPTSVEALWKASRAAWWVGDNLTDRKEKMARFQRGIDLAQAAVKADPNSADAHYWLSANYGSFGETKGILKSLFLVKPIRHELNEVNRIDDKFQGGAGYRILGIVDYKVPGFAGGSKKRALEGLKKSLAMDPKSPFTRYYLAEYYSVIGDKTKSREQLDILDTLTPGDYFDEADVVMMKRKGEKLRKEL
jgi:tetratricopeptide (TPR) repeat protein